MYVSINKQPTSPELFLLSISALPEKGSETFYRLGCRCPRGPIEDACCRVPAALSQLLFCLGLTCVGVMFSVFSKYRLCLPLSRLFALDTVVGLIL